MDQSRWRAGAGRADLGPHHTDPGRHACLSDLLRLMDAAEEADAGSDGYPVRGLPVSAGAVLFREGSPAQSISFVTRGAFKVYRTAEDGYEQVLSFVGRAEVLGFDGLCRRQHSSTAVALEDAAVFTLSNAEILGLETRVPALNRMLHRAASRQLQGCGDVVELMAAVAAEVRLARFLVQLSDRMQACGQSPLRLLLRMCRRDIASYLGLAHETISRSFSALVDWGYLQVDNRDIDILDLERLRELARNTRGLVGLSVRRHADPAIAARTPVRSNPAIRRSRRGDALDLT
ncbi:Crp/Fnr family transcriptional regulator [Roseateles sp. DAIF2]|uniref:Crp/Fnr family transcriptional regulator n=1 Tax=Roseateles sp. DAIF2 TaxID=2714952 RepID=UPI0018A3359F|nr:Crp/Fnr family transcriptional regulator [Roseateles sp. DAIF2]QPF73652.1 Crp/Fnr family transcriptional regulator [Roseateles sp. DAIF2]